MQRKKLSMLRSMSVSLGVTTLMTMLFLFWPVAQAMLMRDEGQSVRLDSHSSAETHRWT